MNDEYKLYVWKNSEGAHHNGIAFAIAKTEEKAKQLVVAKYISEYNQKEEEIIWGTVEILPIKEYGDYSWG